MTHYAGCLQTFIFSNDSSQTWSCVARLLTNCIKTDPQLILAKNHLLIEEETVRKRRCKVINHSLFCFYVRLRGVFI